MSYGKMTTPISIIREEVTTGEAQFECRSDVVLANVRAYMEERHGSVKWANLAAFSDATAMFRFRVISGVTVDPLHVIKCGESRYKVLSAIVLRGMYVEALAKEVAAVGANRFVDRPRKNP